MSTVRHPNDEQKASMALLKRRSDKVAVLSRVPLFSGLSRRELAEIARNVTEVEISPHEYLAFEGEAGNQAMVILSGKVTVRKKGRRVAELSTGDVVGEMSLVTNRPRNATVRADTFVAALVMDAKEFGTVMDQHPQVATKILKTVAERLTDAGHD
jgi:CRP/FNR family cyclic AMP-dependent transcriptional regulator